MEKDNKLEFVIEDIDSSVLERPETIQRILNKFSYEMGLGAKVNVEQDIVDCGFKGGCHSRPVLSVKVIFEEAD